MAWADRTLREFQDALASSDPTPGGGSAAGVALGQAAALSVMVSELTLGKESYSGGWEVSERIKELATPLLDHGLELAQKDSEAFDAVVTSFRLPKKTEEEKDLRHRVWPREGVAVARCAAGVLAQIVRRDAQDLRDDLCRVRDQA